MALDMSRVAAFCGEQRITSKGRLAIMLQLTHKFREMARPINPDLLITDGGGQVRGLSAANCQSILKEYGITRRLSAEAGRTTRAGVGWARTYAALMNDMSVDDRDLAEIERFWVERIREYFSTEPFKLEADSSLSISTAVDDLLAQAKKRQDDQPGSTIVGTVLQQLVAAKLVIVVPEVTVNSASAADGSTHRAGDFNIGDTAIHCTTAPGEQLMSKCRDNVADGLHPIIITVRDRVKNTWDLASDFGVASKLEVWDVQSFLSANVQEHGRFEALARRDMLKQIVNRYNEIVDEFESDPGLKIEYAGGK